jgi:hypothetical protein
LWAQGLHFTPSRLPLWHFSGSLGESGRCSENMQFTAFQPRFGDPVQIWAEFLRLLGTLGCKALPWHCHWSCVRRLGAAGDGFGVPPGVPGGCFGATCVPKVSTLLHSVSHCGTFSDPLSEVGEEATTCYLLCFSHISATRGRPGEDLEQGERTRAAAMAFVTVC